MTLELWELAGRGDCRFSTFCWRTRLALHHKGLDFVIHPVRVTDKETIRFSGQGKLPILRHDDRVICDSWAIAQYVERAFPHRPSLFGNGPGEALTHFFNLWTDRELVPGLIPYLMLATLDCVEETDAAYLRAQIEGVFRKRLEDLWAERQQGLDHLRRRLSPVRKILASHAYIGGETPSYADHILFGTLQWARVISTEQVLEPTDPLTGWFERALDLYGAVGRQEPSREARIHGAAA